MKHLIHDISSDAVCKFCDEPITDEPGQPYGEDLLHGECYDNLGREMSDSFDRPQRVGRVRPPVGSVAFTAFLMADMFPNEDWDAWKDQMKEGLL